MRTLALPSLARSTGAAGEANEPACALRGPGTPRAGGDGLVAACRGATVSVRAADGELAAEADGCAPAWRPDGTVAFVRGGSVLELAVPCAGDCVRELLSRADLRRTGVLEPQVVDHVWLTPTRGVVLLVWPGGGYVLGVFEGRRLVALHRWGGGGPGRLEAAPGGGLFTARPARVFRRDGTPVALAPRFRNARAIDWSPDGRWAAVAMVGAVVLVPTHGLVAGAETRRAIRLPYPARDLAWRPG